MAKSEVKRNYRLVFGKDDVRGRCGKQRLQQWKDDVESGKRRSLTKAEQCEQAAYRVRREDAGRRPMSFERRESLSFDISRKKAKDKIERLQMIKELAEL
jgi:hypothetical protein